VVKANVTAATSTSLTVTTPAGATYKPITVTVNNHPSTNRPPNIQCIDIFGRIVKTVSVKSGSAKTQVITQSFSAGVYKIVWSDGQHSLTKTAMILR